MIGMGLNYTYLYRAGDKLLLRNGYLEEMGYAAIKLEGVYTK